jgi:hypothetical protein
MEVFSKRLFKPSDFIGKFPITAHCAVQGRKQAEGCALFFDYLLYELANVK